MVEILKCGACGRYTLKAECICGGNAISPAPPKANLEDKWGKYRRIYKRAQDKNNAGDRNV